MSMIPIASTVVGAGGTATITFSNIPSTFTHLQLRYFCKDTAVNSNLYYMTATFNSDTGSNYSSHGLTADGATAGSAAQTSASSMRIGLTAGASLQSTSTFVTGIVDILDYTSTNKNKTVRSINGIDANGSGWVYFLSSLWFNSTPAAITTITIPAAVTNFAQYSRFDLYGITNSPATGA